MPAHLCVQVLRIASGKAKGSTPFMLHVAMSEAKRRKTMKEWASFLGLQEMKG